MDGLLAALTMFLTIFSGSGAQTTADAPAQEAGAHAQAADACITSTTTVTVPAQRSAVQDLEKCDSIPGKDARNLCYAQASKDSFFCDRICDQNLKNECLQKISA